MTPDSPTASDLAACAPCAGAAIDPDAASTIAASLKALADPLRLRMLSAVAADPRGESCVCDLAALAEVSQPTVSHHLKVLKDAGILASERRGTWVWYRLAPAPDAVVAAVIAELAPSTPHLEPKEVRP